MFLKEQSWVDTILIKIHHCWKLKLKFHFLLSGLVFINVHLYFVSNVRNPIIFFFGFLKRSLKNIIKMKKERSENEEEKVFSTLFGNKDSKTQEAKSLLISKIFYPF